MLNRIIVKNFPRGTVKEDADRVLTAKMVKAGVADPRLVNTQHSVARGRLYLIYQLPTAEDTIKAIEATRYLHYQATLPVGRASRGAVPFTFLVSEAILPSSRTKVALKDRTLYGRWSLEGKSSIQGLHDAVAAGGKAKNVKNAKNAAGGANGLSYVVMLPDRKVLGDGTFPYLAVFRDPVAAGQYMDKYGTQLGLRLGKAEVAPSPPFLIDYPRRKGSGNTEADAQEAAFLKEALAPHAGMPVDVLDEAEAAKIKRYGFYNKELADDLVKKHPKAHYPPWVVAKQQRADLHRRQVIATNVTTKKVSEALRKRLKTLDMKDGEGLGYEYVEKGKMAIITVPPGPEAEIVARTGMLTGYSAHVLSVAAQDIVLSRWRPKPKTAVRPAAVPQPQDRLVPADRPRKMGALRLRLNNMKRRMQLIDEYQRAQGNEAAEKELRAKLLRMITGHVSTYGKSGLTAQTNPNRQFMRRVHAMSLEELYGYCIEYRADLPGARPEDARYFDPLERRRR